MLLCLPATGSMQTLRREPIDSGFKKLNVLYLPLWSCLPLVVWNMKPPIFTTVWLPF